MFYKITVLKNFAIVTVIKLEMKNWASADRFLTHFMPLISFDTPENMFSGGIKRDQWHETG